MTILHRISLAVAALALGAVALSCSRTGDLLQSVPEGATKAEVVERLGTPVDPSTVPGEEVAVASKCASPLVYKDEYLNSAIRSLDDAVSCGGSWLILCFDEDGQIIPGRLSWRMVNC